MAAPGEISPNERGLRDSLEYFNRNLEAVLAGEEVPPHPWLSPDIEIVNFEPSPFPGTYHGAEGARQWTRDIFGDFADASLEVVDVVERGDLIAARLRLTGTGRSSGATGTLEWGAVATVREGRCVRFAGDVSYERALQRLEKESE